MKKELHEFKTASQNLANAAITVAKTKMDNIAGGLVKKKISDIKLRYTDEERVGNYIKNVKLLCISVSKNFLEKEKMKDNLIKAQVLAYYVKKSLLSKLR